MVDVDDGAAEFRRDVESAIHRWLGRGMFLADEVVPKIGARYRTAIEQLPDGVSARPFAKALVDGFCAAWEAEMGSAPDASTVVPLAVAAYRAEKVVAAGRSRDRTDQAWNLIDDDHPGLRDRALADVRRGGAASRCLHYLWRGPDVREVLDELLDKTTDLDDRLTLVTTCRGLFAGDDTDVLEVLRTAVGAGDIAVALRCVDSLVGDASSVTEPVHAVLTQIVDDIVGSDAPDPDGRRVVIGVVVAGLYGDDEAVTRVLTCADRVFVVHDSPENGYTHRAGFDLGRAAFAAFLAGENGWAAEFARMHVAESPDAPGWECAGEDILAHYVLGLLDDDPVARADHLATAVNIARHGQVAPLFAIIHFEAAKAALALPESSASDSDVQQHIGYGRYLECVAAQHPSGHFWNPIPIAALARRLPSDPLPWASLAIRLAHRAGIEIPTEDVVAQAFRKRFGAAPSAEAVTVHTLRYACGHARRYETVAEYFRKQR